MTNLEYKTHFTLWAIAKAPLIIGCDLASIKNIDLEILKNTEIIAINQDPLGRQAMCIKSCSWLSFHFLHLSPQIWITSLVDSYAVVIMNWNFFPLIWVNIKLGELGIPAGTYTVRDLWLHQDIGTLNNMLNIGTVKYHDCLLYTSPSPRDS